MRAWILALVIVACTGCPDTSQPQQTATLNLDTSTDVPRPLKVGDRASLNLTLKRGEVNKLFGAGAFIADESSQRLTSWHSEPEGAVRFDGETNEVHFETPGDVEVWASWADADGTRLESNRLSFSVADAPR